MTQYCRYCAWLVVNNMPYCTRKKTVLAERFCKRANHCKGFTLVDAPVEYQDAFGENPKGYIPRARKAKLPVEEQRLF